MVGIFCLLGSSACFAWGTVLLGQLAQQPSWKLGGLAALVILIANALFVGVVRYHTLTSTSYVLSSMTTFLIVSAVSWWVLKEPLNSYQFTGLGFAVLVIVLMSFPNDGAPS